MKKREEKEVRCFVSDLETHPKAQELLKGLAGRPINALGWYELDDELIVEANVLVHIPASLLDVFKIE